MSKIKKDANLCKMINYRAKIMEAKNNGEQCATSMLPELAETDTCNIVACPRGIFNKNGD